MTTDRGRGLRGFLGFDRHRRDYGAKVRKLECGLPSEATMSRHNRRFSQADRLETWRIYFERLREQNLAAMSQESSFFHRFGRLGHADPLHGPHLSLEEEQGDWQKGAKS